ncbi:transporter substrate-binding domain-containing protein [Pseudomonas carnis]|uniref:ATP-binding protein n=1 Tax=Pseudomonas carnis TaxID=2487355 RepID=UPI0018D9FFF1|nr:transporter substrate-binding domain-containing protein [Pseudomonas carnis]MBH3465730.1 transporter substrate-binding domain-containing protein [Pseudomonas carnis]
MKVVRLRLLLGWLLLASAGLADAQADPPSMTLTQQERDWIAANPVLRVGVFDNLLPFEYISDGQLRGLSAKYLGLIAARTGLHFQSVVTGNRSARKDMLISGEVDILPTRRRDDDPVKDLGMRYTTPYNTSSTILVSRFGQQPFVDLEQLAGKRLVMLGREGYQAFLQQKVPGITVISGQNAVDIMAMVKDGRADAAIASEWLLIPYLSRQYQGVLQVSGVVPQLHTGVSMAVRDSDAILLSILEKVLGSISNDERKAIYDAWFDDMNLDIPTIKDIAEHFQGELWLLLSVVLLLIAFAWQSRRQRRQAVQSEREKAMFLAVVSHEVRSPMNAVLAAIELLEHTPLDEQQRHFTQLANSGANTLLRLVDDVLDISRMEAGELTLTLEPVDLWALVQQVVEEYRAGAEEKGLLLTLSGERPSGPLMLEGMRLSQVLRNLISNAVKFTEVGGVEVQLKVVEWPEVPVPHVLIRIIDSGIGLSQQAQASLFRSYARAKHSYKRTGGSGLGLVICRRLVRLMSGELTLNSTQGVGTEVEVKLSVEWAKTLDIPQAEAAQAQVEGNGVHVLVVQAPVTGQQTLPAHLQALGCRVLLAVDGAQGLTLFNVRRVDMVLIDCDLPNSEIEPLAGAFRELEQVLQRAHCPLVAVAGFSDNEHLERCFDAGLDGVLVKPVTPAKLQQMIELWCDMPQGPLPAMPKEEPEEESHILRKAFNDLIEALALRERSQALQAVQRLHEAALGLERDDLVGTVESLGRLLRDERDWPAQQIAERLSVLLGQRPAPA